MITPSWPCGIFRIFGKQDYKRCKMRINVKINLGRSLRKQLSTTTRLFNSRLDLNWNKKPVKCYIWSIALCGAVTWTLRKVDQKYLESFEMWCWRRMEEISWTDRVRNEEVLQRGNEEGNIVHRVKRKKANWIGNILRRNCLLKHVIWEKIEGKIEV
jgi:hypothetical protein